MIPNFLRTSAVTLVSSAALAISVVAPSSALTFGGSLDPTDPTWRRPGSGNPPTTLAGNASSSYYYDVFNYTPVSTGRYQIVVNSTSPLNPYVALYDTAFDPVNQFNNLLRGNNNLNGSATQAGFPNVLLTAGTQYVVVVSSGPVRTNLAGVGSYSGEIAPVPFAFSPLPGLAATWAARGVRRRIAAKKEVLQKA